MFIYVISKKNDTSNIPKTAQILHVSRRLSTIALMGLLKEFPRLKQVNFAPAHAPARAAVECMKALGVELTTGMYEVQGKREREIEI